MRSTKGLELSIRTLVLLSIGLIVLLAVVSFFMGVWGPGGKTIDCQARIQGLCTQYVAQGCCEDGDDCPEVSNLPAKCQGDVNLQNACC